MSKDETGYERWLNSKERNHKEEFLVVSPQAFKKIKKIYHDAAVFGKGELHYNCTCLNFQGEHEENCRSRYE